METELMHQQCYEYSITHSNECMMQRKMPQSCNEKNVLNYNDNPTFWGICLLPRGR